MADIDGRKVAIDALAGRWLLDRHPALPVGSAVLVLPVLLVVLVAPALPADRLVERGLRNERCLLIVDLLTFLGLLFDAPGCREVHPVLDFLGGRWDRSVLIEAPNDEPVGVLDPVEWWIRWEGFGEKRFRALAGPGCRPHPGVELVGL